MRDDFMGSAPRNGLILHHEHQSIWKDKTEPPRVPSTVLDAMREDDDRFIAGYQDPLSLDDKISYWGAFRPIHYEVINPETGYPDLIPSGWMVLVQTPSL